MLGFLKKLFGSKPAEAQTAEAPYKVETPEVVVSVQLQCVSRVGFWTTKWF